MITGILLVLCILTSGFAGNVYKKLSQESDGAAASTLMPAVWFTLLSAVFAISAAITGEIFRMSLLPAAIISGICFAVTVVLHIEAMKTNTISITVIIINMNFIIPVLLSAIFLDEAAAPLQVIGILLSIVVIVALNISGSTEEKEAGTALFCSH